MARYAFVEFYEKMNPSSGVLLIFFLVYHYFVNYHYFVSYPPHAQRE